MKRGAHGEQFRELCTPFLGELRTALHRRRITRDHDLLWRIDVSGRTYLALSRIPADLGNLRQFHSQDRRHGADADRHRLLHVLAAIADGAHRVGQAHGPRRHVSGILAQALACDKCRLGDMALKNSQRRDRGGKNCRLGDFGQTQLFFRTLKAQLRQFVTQGVVGFFKRLPGGRIFFGEILSHSNGLRSLAGEDKCDLRCREFGSGG